MYFLASKAEMYPKQPQYFLIQAVSGVILTVCIYILSKTIIK